MQISSNQSFISNAFKLIAATSFAQVLGILITPLLTRIYAPEVFGLLQIYLSIVYIISPLCTCDYEVAILLPDDEEDAKSILCTAIILTTVVSILCVIGLYLPTDPILKVLNAQKLGSYVYLIPLSVFCTGTFNAMSYWLTRKENFGLIAICRSAQAFINQGSKLALGIFSAGSFIAFLSGNILSDMAQVLIMLFYCSREILNSIKGKSFWKRVKYNMVRFYRFPLFSFPAKFIYQGTSELPALMFAYFFSPTIVGYYALGCKLLWIPIDIVSKAVSRVLLQQVAANKKDEVALKALATRVLECLAILSIFPMAIIV